MARVVVNPGYNVRDTVNRRDAGPGTEIDVSEKHARVLKALKRVSEPQPRDVRPAPPRPARETTPEPEPAAAVTEAAPAAVESLPAVSATATPRGRYARRDMRATEEEI